VEPASRVQRSHDLIPSDYQQFHPLQGPPPSFFAPPRAPLPKKNPRPPPLDKQARAHEAGGLRRQYGLALPSRGSPDPMLILRIEPTSRRPSALHLISACRFWRHSPGMLPAILSSVSAILAHVSGRPIDKARRTLDHQKAFIGHDDLVTCHGGCRLAAEAGKCVYPGRVTVR